MRARLTIAAVLGAALFVVSPAGAFAADRFVDRDTGADLANACLSSATPCESISNAVLQAAAGDTIKVDDSPLGYPGFELSGSSDLSVTGAFEFVGGDEGAVLIDAGGSIAVEVPPGTGGGTISRLTIRSTNVALQIADALTVSENRFDGGGSGDDIRVLSSSPTITGNQFIDPSTALLDRGVNASNGSPVITDNDFNGLSVAIALGNDGATPNAVVTGNTIAGVHQSPSQGRGIAVTGSTGVLIEDNSITSPAPGGATSGIDVSTGGVGPTSAILRRNQVYDHGTGVSFNNTTSAEMNGDIVAGSTDIGLVGFDDPGGIEGGNVNAKNVTIADAGPSATRDVFLADATLSLDSSIVGDDGVDESLVGHNCVITNSRGPTTTPGASGCGGFQVTAAPEFVNPAANDYSLTENNPELIDAGDPGAPIAPNTIDFEGDKREMDGDGDCDERRDIGADEYQPPVPNLPTIDSGPAAGSVIQTAAAQFAFSSDYPCGPTFECSLDGASFTTCGSPVTLGPLAEGAHTFAVRALDLVPEAGAEASRSFTVDLPDPPVTTPPAKCKKPKKKGKKKGKKKKKKCRK